MWDRILATPFKRSSLCAAGGRVGSFCDQQQNYTNTHFILEQCCCYWMEEDLQRFPHLLKKISSRSRTKLGEICVFFHLAHSEAVFSVAHKS